VNARRTGTAILNSRSVGVAPGTAKTDGVLRLLRTVVDNPVKAWPRTIYRERLFRSRVLGRDTIYVMAPDLIRKMLADEADNFEKGEIARRGLGPVLGDAILTADGSRWRWQRHAVASIFRQERIRNFLPAMVAAAERTRNRWLSYPPGSEIDVAREMMRTTFDIILNTLLSGRGGIDCDLMQQSITNYLEPTSWIIALAMVRAPRWVPYPGRRKARRARDRLHHVLDFLIDEAKRNPSNRDDLLSLLTNATDPETDKSMNDLDVRYNLLTFITAGHETTAVALTWTFYLLSLHPEVEQQVKSEIAGVTGGRPLCASHLELLPYTTQVIQEAMRLYPPVPLLVRAPRQDIRLENEEIRAGTPLYVPIYAVHRHEAYWRKPDEFDPSRFEPETAKAHDRYTYLPFGAGPRICIGQTFAQWEATAVLVTLLNSFRLRLRSDYIPEPRLRVTLRPAGGMPMRIA
jgi:cytochrome P450